MERNDRLEQFLVATPPRSLIEFLSRSECCLLGQFDGAGELLAANPCLRQRLGSEARPAFEDALEAASARSWSAALGRLNHSGWSQVIELHFTPSPGTDAAFRCLLQRGVEGSIWLFGEPLAASRPANAADRLADLERARAAAESLALTDDLTGIANRRHVELWLRQEDARVAGHADASLACLMVDLDHFKEVNDTYGHSVGDSVLQAVANALAAGVRAPDRVARYGGDEFLILLPDTDLMGAVAVSVRLRAALAAVQVPPLDRGMGASVGVAVLQAGERTDLLVERADAALLRAKRSGRDRVETA